MSIEVRERVSKVKPATRRASRLPYGLSAVEVAAASIAMLLFAIVVVYYFMVVSAEQDNLRRLEEQDNAQRIEIANSMPKGPAQAPKVDEGKAASDSLRTFKEQYLLSRRETESRLRDMINTLTTKHGVQLVGGIPMSVFRADMGAEQGDTKRKLEQQALEKFPRLETEFSIAGDYARLRAFVAELEGSNLMTLVNSISLVSQEEREEGTRAKATGAIQLTIKLSIPFEDQ
jgi:hypothetical protein